VTSSTKSPLVTSAFMEKKSVHCHAGSTWGQYFRNAELEKMLNQDLSRLYPELGDFFQTSTCQSMLGRILLVWSLRYPEFGYRQGKSLISFQSLAHCELFISWKNGWYQLKLYSRNMICLSAHPRSWLLILYIFKVCHYSLRGTKTSLLKITT